jgi:DNA-binding MarR family transcriptional regulator
MARGLGVRRELVEARELRLAVGRLARRMKQLYDADELTFSESSLLSRLGREGPATPTELAGAEHVRPQAMGNMLTTLEQRGLVARSPDPDDGRRLIVRLRPAGRRLLEAKHEHVNEAIRTAMSRFTAAEQQQLIAAVELLDRLAERL